MAGRVHNPYDAVSTVAQALLWRLAAEYLLCQDHALRNRAGPTYGTGLPAADPLSEAERPCYSYPHLRRSLVVGNGRRGFRAHPARWCTRAAAVRAGSGSGGASRRRGLDVGLAVHGGGDAD